MFELIDFVLYLTGHDLTINPLVQILASNGVCEDDSAETCVKKLTVLYEEHVLLIGNDISQEVRTMNVSSISILDKRPSS